MHIDRRKLLHTGGLATGLLLPASAHGVSAAPIDQRPRPVAFGPVQPGTLYTIHGDGTDTTALWREALDGIARVGHGAVRVSGHHVISRELTLPDVSAFEIIGDGDAVLRKAQPGREFCIFGSEPHSAALPTLTIRNIRCVGDWDEVPTMGGDDSRCIAVRGYSRVVLQGVTAEGFRNMSLTADDCDEVLVESCRILRSGRDPINLTGSRFVKVVNCTIQNAWDDAIAVHVPRDVTDERRRYATIISNNHILQANGIKVLGGRDVTITGNQIIAPNNYGIYLGRDPFWREGGVPHANVIISDNIVGEMIPHEYLSGQGDVGTGIFVFDPGWKVYSTRIFGNVITKYKPAGHGIRYSDWGFGPDAGERRLFTADGWTDPKLIYGHQGKGIRVYVVAANADDRENLIIESNLFANLASNVERDVRV